MATRGRPPVHDRDAIMRQVCDAISEGAFVNDAAKVAGTTAKSIREWAAESPELGALYAQARERQADYYAEQALELADAAIPGKGGDVDKVRVQVDTRKWLASKLNPRRFGDSKAVDVTSGGKPVSGVVMLPSVTDE